MKRLISLALTLALVLSAVCCAAAEGVVFRTDYFTVTLPDGWEADTDTSGFEQYDDYQYLGCFLAPDDIGMIAGAYLAYYEDWSDFSLWNADEASIQDYVDVILEDLEDDSPEFLGLVYAGSIPFVLIRAADDYGDYLYAETMTNGYAIQFDGYVTDLDGIVQYPLSEEDIEVFRSILISFQPVTGS